MKNATRIGMTSVTVLMLLASSGCDDVTSYFFPPATQGGYEVVAVLPFIGSFASRGESHQAALQSALVALDEAGFADRADKGINITYVSGDQPKDVVVAELQALIDERDIAAIISSTGAPHKASIGLAVANQIPHFELSTGGDNWEFIHYGSDERNALDMSYSFSTRALCFPEAILTARYLDTVYAGQRLVLLRGKKEHDEMHTQAIRQELHRLLNEDPEGDHIIVADEIGFAPADLGSREPGDDGWLERVNDLAYLDTLPTENGDGTYRLSYDTAVFLNPIVAAVGDGATAGDFGDVDIIFYHLRGDTNNLTMLQNAVDANFIGGGSGGEIVTCGMSKKNNIIGFVSSGGYVTSFDQSVTFVSREPQRIGDTDDSVYWQYRNWFTENNPSVADDAWTAGAFDALVLVGLGLLESDGELNGSLRDAIRRVARDDSGSDPVYTVRNGSRGFNVDGLAEALKAIADGEDINFEGASGSLDFNPENRVPGDYNVQVVSADDVDPDASDPQSEIGAYVDINGWGRGDAPCMSLAPGDGCFVDGIEFQF